MRFIPMIYSQMILFLQQIVQRLALSIARAALAALLSTVFVRFEHTFDFR